MAATGCIKIGLFLLVHVDRGALLARGLRIFVICVRSIQIHTIYLQRCPLNTDAAALAAIQHEEYYPINSFPEYSNYP
jgi:hypothetical protein